MPSSICLNTRYNPEPPIRRCEICLLRLFAVQENFLFKEFIDVIFIRQDNVVGYRIFISIMNVKKVLYYCTQIVIKYDDDTVNKLSLRG